MEFTIKKLNMTKPIFLNVNTGFIVSEVLNWRLSACNKYHLNWDKLQVSVFKCGVLCLDFIFISLRRLQKFGVEIKRYISFKFRYIEKSASKNIFADTIHLKQISDLSVKGGNQNICIK